MGGAFPGFQLLDWLEIYSMVQDGDTSPERAARRLGITIPILKSRMIVSGYRYPEV